MEKKLEKIPYRWVIWVMGLLAEMVPWFLLSIWSMAGVYWMQELNLTLAQFGSSVSAMMLGLLIFGIPAGFWIDKAGGKVVCSVGFIACAIGTLLLPYTGSFAQAFVCRIIQGIGLACIYAPAQTMVMGWFTRDEVSTATGGIIAGVALGGVLAYLSDPLIAAIGWQNTCLYTGGAVIVLLIVFIIFAVSKPQDKGYPSVAEIEASLGLADTGTDTSGAAAESVWSLKVIKMYIIWLFSCGLYTVYSAWTPMVYEIKGYSLTLGGQMTALALVLAALTAIIGGRVADRLGRRHIQLRVAFVIIAICFGMIGFSPGVGLASFFVVAAACVTYYANPPFFGLLGILAPPKAVGLTFGINGSLCAVGGFLFPWIVGMAAGQGGAEGLQKAFILIVVLALVMWGLTFLVKDPTGKPAKEIGKNISA